MSLSLFLHVQQNLEQRRARPGQPEAHERSETEVNPWLHLQPLIGSAVWNYYFQTTNSSLNCYSFLRFIDLTLLKYWPLGGALRFSWNTGTGQQKGGKKGPSHNNPMQKRGDSALSKWNEWSCKDIAPCYLGVYYGNSMVFEYNV